MNDPKYSLSERAEPISLKIGPLTRAALRERLTELEASPRGYYRLEEIEALTALIRAGEKGRGRGLRPIFRQTSPLAVRRDDPFGSQSVKGWLLAMLASLRAAPAPRRAFDRPASLWESQRQIGTGNDPRPIEQENRGRRI